MKRVTVSNFGLEKFQCCESTGCSGLIILNWNKESFTFFVTLNGRMYNAAIVSSVNPASILKMNFWCTLTCTLPVHYIIHYISFQLLTDLGWSSNLTILLTFANNLLISFLNCIIFCLILLFQHGSSLLFSAGFLTPTFFATMILAAACHQQPSCFSRSI